MNLKWTDKPNAKMLNSKLHQNQGWKGVSTMIPATIANLTGEDLQGIEITIDDRDWKIILTAIVVMGLIIMIALSGNAIVILAFHKCKTLRTPSNLFLLNLAVCDMLTVSVLPFSMYTYIADQWQFDAWICKFVAFITSMLPGTTLMNISFIAWNRYALVINQSFYHRMFTPSRVKWMIMSTWCLPATILILPLFEVWGTFAFIPVMATCNLLMNHESQSFKLTLYLIRAGIPCLLVMYCYCYIYHKMRRSHKKIKNIISNAQSHSLIAAKQEQHLTKTTAAIFAIFIVSYFPCTITTIVDWNNVLSKKFHMFCQITVYLSCAVNPFIYGLMNSQFNEAFHEILQCRGFSCWRNRVECISPDVNYDEIKQVQGDDESNSTTPSTHKILHDEENSDE